MDLKIFKDKLIMSFLVLNIFVVVFGIFLIAANLSDEAGDLIVGYNIDGSIIKGRTASAYSVVAILGLILTMNFFLAYDLYRKDPFFSRILAGVSLFVSTIGLILLFLIVGFN